MRTAYLAEVKDGVATERAVFLSMTEAAIWSSERVSIIWKRRGGFAPKMAIHIVALHDDPPLPPTASGFRRVPETANANTRSEEPDCA